MKRTALITGATSGIGKAIAEYYKRLDYDIISVSRTAPEYKYDLSDQAQVADFLLTLSHLGKIDVLINNAGVMNLKENTLNACSMWTLLLYTPATLIATLYQLDLFSKDANITNIASVSGIVGDADLPMYSALKAGLINLTKSFAKKLAPHVRVNCISPGFFNTNLVEGDVPRELIKHIPMRREADPVEIKQIIDMLDQSPYITGANIIIDGGLSL